MNSDKNPRPDQAAMPADPMTELAQGAAQLHELFTAHIAAGFTRGEALKIIIGVISSAVSHGAGGDGK